MRVLTMDSQRTDNGEWTTEKTRGFLPSSVSPLFLPKAVIQPAWQRRDGQPFPGLFLTGLRHIEIPRIIADCSRVGWALDFPTRSLVPQVLPRLKQRACPGS